MSTLAADKHHMEQHRVAASTVDEIEGYKRRWQRENRRPRALTAREALAAMQFEATVIWCYGKSLVAGATPSAVDEERVTLAMRRVNELAGEAIG